MDKALWSRNYIFLDLENLKLNVFNHQKGSFFLKTWFGSWFDQTLTLIKVFLNRERKWSFFLNKLRFNVFDLTNFHFLETSTSYSRKTHKIHMVWIRAAAILSQIRLPCFQLRTLLNFRTRETPVVGFY